MDKTEMSHVFTNVLFKSEYFLQITLDKHGIVLDSSASMAHMLPVFDKKDVPLKFNDYFIASQWTEFQAVKKQAKQDSQSSFTIVLQQQVELKLITSKWEFFFLSDDSETCKGIGHQISTKNTYNIKISDILNSAIAEDQSIIEGILDNKLLGFWEFDLNRKSNTINEDLFQFLGYDQNDQLAKSDFSWQDCIHPDDYADLRSHIDTNQNMLIKKKFRLVHKNTQLIWVYGLGKLICWNESGEPTKLLGCFIDITSQKKEGLRLEEYQYFLNEIAFEQSHTLRAKVANILGILEILDGEPDTEEVNNLFVLLKAEAKLLDSSLKKSIKKTKQKNQTIANNLSID